jgi:RNase P protein component
VRNRFKRWLREYFQNYLLDKQEDSAKVQLQVVLYSKNSDMMGKLERNVFFDILQSGISKLDRVVKRQGQN